VKATGVVRRIDDLGRIVIPIEIRRTMRIRDGDPLEIFVDKDGEVILKKYSAMVDLSDYAQAVADSLHESSRRPVLITDRDAVVSVAGVGKKGLAGKAVSETILRSMQERQTIVLNAEEGRNRALLEDGEDQEQYHSKVVSPVIVNGDPMGAVVLLAPAGEQPVSDLEVKLAETAAGFLSRYMEE